MTSKTVKVTAECDFELEGVQFRIYNNALWVDGDVEEDLLIAEFEALADIDDYDTEIEITVTDQMIQYAREYVDYINEAEMEEDFDRLFDGNDWQRFMGDADEAGYADDADSVRATIETLYGHEYSANQITAIVQGLAGYVRAEMEAAAITASLNSLMTVKEVADEYGITERGIRATIERGSIPARQSGKTWLMRRTDVIDQWGCPSEKAQEMAQNYLDARPGLTEDFDIHAGGEWYTFEVIRYRGQNVAQYAHRGPRNR